jgi:hypothetical protein
VKCVRAIEAILAVTERNVIKVKFAGTANAQGADFPKVEIKAVDIGNNIYRLGGKVEKSRPLGHRQDHYGRL